MIEHRIGVSGEYRCILYDNEDDMNVVSDTDWNPNLITDQGLDLWHTNAPFSRTYVGSGTDVADVADTQMQAYIPGGQSNVFGSGNAINVAGGSPDYEYSQTRSKRFNAGVGTGPINEIAMGASTDDTGTLIFNRVVLGATINKAALQVLDVIFRLTIWPPVIDVIGTGPTVSTISGVSYETITRALDIDTYSGSTTFEDINFRDAGFWVAYDGDLGLITDTTPQGTDGDTGLGGGLTVDAYVPGSKELTCTYGAELTWWVTDTDEIRTIKGWTRHFQFQTQFDATAGGAKIPKDGTEIMDMSWKITWDRKP
jgi:hypothetical protein